MAKPKFENMYRELAAQHELLSAYIYDEKRGHAGTEAELALATAEADLASAMEQVAFVQAALKR